MADEPKWKDVVRHVEDELRRLTALLEAHQPEHLTNQLRGEIRSLRRLLTELGEPKAPTPPDKMIQPESDRFV
jgi:hypothetical protein